MWSVSSLGQNDFLGEIHIPLANCTLDIVQEHQLLAQKKKNDVSSETYSLSLNNKGFRWKIQLVRDIEPTMDPAEIIFQLTFIENSKNKDIGTIQVHNVQGKAIFFGKHQVEAICKG